MSQAGAYALTHGVNAELWETWCKQHHDSPLLRNRSLFAHGADNEVQAEIKDNADTRSGLEPVDPDKPPVTLARIEPADRD